MKLGCSILAGGSGSRAGGVNKALIEVDGAPIIIRILSDVTRLFSDISIITGQPEAFTFIEGAALIPDKISGAGPLGGIYTAMKQSRSDALFIVAGDMPFLSLPFIKKQCGVYLQKPCDILTPRFYPGNKSGTKAVAPPMIEPLHSIYSVALADKLGSYIKDTGKLSIRGFIQSVNACFIDIPDDNYTRRMFTNVNNKEDFCYEKTA